MAEAFNLLEEDVFDLLQGVRHRADVTGEKTGFDPGGVRDTGLHRVTEPFAVAHARRQPVGEAGADAEHRIHDNELVVIRIVTANAGVPHVKMQLGRRRHGNHFLLELLRLVDGRQLGLADPHQKYGQQQLGAS